MKKKVLLILFCFTLVCGCSAPKLTDPPPPQSQGETQGEDFYGWADFQDLSRKKIAFQDGAVKGLDLGYAVGWNFDGDDCQEIQRDDQIGGCKVIDIASNYLIQYNGDLPPSAICNRNEYRVYCGKTINGVLEVNQNGLAFYAYPNSGQENFLFVCERTQEAERAFSEQAAIQVSPNQRVDVQPIMISLSGTEGSDLSKNLSSLLGTDASEEAFQETIEAPLYFDARIKFNEIYFYPYSQGEGAGIFGTRAVGYYDQEINIGQLKKFE